MEAVPAYTRVGVFARQPEQLCDVRLGAMESRIETGDLRYFWCSLRDCDYGGKIVRLVQGGQRRQLGERGHHLAVDADWRSVLRPAMHDPMSDAYHALPLEQLDSCFKYFLSPSSMIESIRGPAKSGNRLALGTFDVQTGRHADLLYLPAIQQILCAPRLIERKFDARRTGIDDRDGSAHRSASRAEPECLGTCASNSETVAMARHSTHRGAGTA
jgi:hypothetical protein